MESNQNNNNNKNSNNNEKPLKIGIVEMDNIDSTNQVVSSNQEVVIIDQPYYQSMLAVSTDPMFKKPSSSPSKDDKPKYGRLHPKFYFVDHINETRLIVGSMFFKFAFETLSSALGLLVLTRFDEYGVTLLAVMNIVYFLSQSFGSILVGPFIRKFRPSRVTSIVFLMMAAVISFILILEVSYKGTLSTLASWNKWLIIIVYVVMGTSLGMVEVSRKLAPRQILGNDSVRLSKLNGLVHLFYEVSGTAGAFLSTALIKTLGPVYALVLMPPFFIIASISFFVITQPFPPQKELINSTPTNPGESAVLSALRTVGTECLNYAKTIGRGAKLIINPRHWWIIFTYVIPQVLHRLLENLLFPVFAKKVLHDGSLSGILTGGSNFGEVCGALLVVKFNKYVHNPMWWVRLDTLFCSLVWVLVYPPKGEPILVAASLIPIMACVSCSWAAGDISLLSYIQSTFPLNVASMDHVSSVADTPDENDRSEVSDSESIEEAVDDLSDSSASANAKELHIKDDAEPDEEDPAEGSPLASVMGFLFAIYAIIISLLSFGLGRVMDNAAANGDLQQGFFWVAGVGFSGCAFVGLVASWFPKKEYFTKSNQKKSTTPSE